MQPGGTAFAENMALPLGPPREIRTGGDRVHDEVGKDPQVQIVSEADHPIKFNIGGDRRSDPYFVRIKEIGGNLAKTQLTSDDCRVIEFI